MPVITIPPVVVDPIRGPDPTATDGLFTGPFSFNGKLYCFGSATDVPPFGVPIIYESSDNGATWTDITGSGSDVLQGFIWCWGDTVPNPEIITFAYPSGGRYKLQDFDLNTKTWGTSYGTSGGPVTTFNGDTVVRLSDGTVKLFTSGGLSIRYSVCVAGTWTITDFDTTRPATPNAACVDSDDLVCVVAADAGDGDTHRSYWTLDTSNVLGTVHDFPTITGGIGQQYMIRLYIGPDDKVYISGAGAFAGVAANDVVMWVGSGSHDAPTWVEQLVCDIPVKIDPTYGLQFQYAANIGGVPYVFFEVSTFDALNYFVYYSRYASGVWEDPVFYYDPQTNPPPGDTDTGFIMSGLSVTSCPTDEKPLVLVFNSSADTGQTPQFMMADGFEADGCSSPTQTLELTKLVSGGPAVPGDFTLSAVGGTDTLSGQGHVGPSEVAADTYELDEVILSGATWDDDSGTWSSDDSTWDGNYIPGAWDCGDAEMPTATSVIVPPGGVVACRITNTYQAPIPPPPPPPAGNDAVGCFELLRLDVTLMPARHLPTRGSVK